MNKILKMIFLCFLIISLSKLTSCKTDNPESETVKSNYCCQKYGCLNAKLIETFEKKCIDNKSSCRFSFEDLFGDLDKVYFIGKFAISFEDCKKIPIPKGFGDNDAQFCQFILLEKDGEVIGYLRGYCTSDVKLKENRIGINPENIDLVSIMDASEKVLIKRIIEGENKYYYIDPPDSKLTKFRDDDCIGLP